MLPPVKIKNLPISIDRVDDAKSVNILKKWQQAEDERERIAATVGQASNVDRSNPYSDIAAAATGVSATAATANDENFWSMSYASTIQSHENSLVSE